MQLFGFAIFLLFFFESVCRFSKTLMQSSGRIFVTAKSEPTGLSPVNDYRHIREKPRIVVIVFYSSCRKIKHTP